jgi:hypothetical protein
MQATITVESVDVEGSQFHTSSYVVWRPCAVEGPGGYVQVREVPAGCRWHLCCSCVDAGVVVGELAVHIRVCL